MSSWSLAAPSEAIHYDIESINTSDFKDRIAFESSKYTEETKCLEELVRPRCAAGFADDALSCCAQTVVLNRGEAFVSQLYTYRSCSKAMPMVGTETEEKMRTDIHKKTFEILRPEILKMRELMDFHEQAIGVIKNNIQILIKPEKEKATQSEEILDLIVKAIDMLVLLDALKDMKACLLNDFSRYKRCVRFAAPFIGAIC